MPTTPPCRDSFRSRLARPGRTVRQTRQWADMLSWALAGQTRQGRERVGLSSPTRNHHRDLGSEIAPIVQGCRVGRVFQR